MRRLVLCAIVVLAVATMAGATVQGAPDAVYITQYIATTSLAVDNVPGSSTFTTLGVLPGGGLDVSTTLAGTSDGIGTGFQFGPGGGSVVIEAYFNSPQGAYQSGFSPNFVLYMGDSVAGTAISTTGTVTFQTLGYDTTGTGSFGGTVLMQFYPYVPSVVWTSQGPVTWSYSVAGPSSPVYGLRIFLQTTVGSTFYIDAIQNPEPGTMALFCLGVCGLGYGVVRRRRRGKKA